MTTTSTSTGQAAGGPEQQTPRTYGNWRKPATPGLPGLGLLGTVVGFGGIVLVVLVQMIAGLMPAALSLLAVTVLLVPLLYRNRSGRNGWQAGAARLLWLRGRRSRQHLYRSGLAGPVPYGQHTLPGLLARSTLYDAVDAYGQPFALLHVPATRHFSVVLRCDPEGSQLVDPETSDTWVAQWGRWLAELPREPNLEAAMGPKSALRFTPLTFKVCITGLPCTVFKVGSVKSVSVMVGVEVTLPLQAICVAFAPFVKRVIFSL